MTTELSRAIKHALDGAQSALSYVYHRERFQLTPDTQEQVMGALREVEAAIKQVKAQSSASTPTSGSLNSDPLTVAEFSRCGSSGCVFGPKDGHDPREMPILCQCDLSVSAKASVFQLRAEIKELRAALRQRMAESWRPISAATEWIKFDRASIDAPRAGEWCLWTFITKHGREYYSGCWMEMNGKVMLKTEYGWTAEATDPYYARVNKLFPSADSVTVEETDSEGKVNRHPLAIAWDYWRKSPEGIKATEPTTLNATPGQRQYLENRLWRAFIAGGSIRDTLCGNCGQRYVGPYENDQHGIGKCSVEPNATEE